ncbi:hypothetical protein SVAN01_07132 [Stagonosporopsis vannaccii]|nr:hypothetical protein SVAN01_07132 [Stagonosporopsis vannaccii]
MPSLRCAMWIQHTGGGSAHVKYGVPYSIPANYKPLRLPNADLTRLGIAWPPPPGSRQGSNLLSCLSATRSAALSGSYIPCLQDSIACF